MGSLQLSDGMWEHFKKIGLGDTVHQVRKDNDLEALFMIFMFHPGMNERGEEIYNIMKLLHRPFPYTMNIRDGVFSVS